VAISDPANGATIAGAVHLVATAAENQAISQTQVWDNGVKLGVYGTQVDAVYNLAPGEHTTTVEDLDSTWHPIHQSSVTYTVQPLVDGVEIASPSEYQVISGKLTVHIVAQANESEPISQMQVWDNGVKLGWFAGSEVNQYYTLAAGVHTLTVEDLDSSFSVIHRSAVTYSVE
jgi:phosphatidylinositol-3-phosphatase